MEKLKPSELILNSDGSIYHLHLKPQDIADTIILVGDPGRVEIVSSFFDSIADNPSLSQFGTGRCSLHPKMVPTRWIPRFDQLIPYISDLEDR